jgi:glycosyltransferase involved in cell wall biosynthesis
MNDKPLVSIVIPTCNSDRFLERCLRSVKEQSYYNIEIIVVDNYSTDRTREIAERFADLVLLKGPERSAQVNFGVSRTHGEYVYRVDSDFALEPTVVEEAVRKCEVEAFDAVCVHNTSDGSIGFWAMVRKLERDCYAGDKLNVAARFFSKDVFRKVGGFDEGLVAGEDYDLHNQLIRNNYKIGYIRAKEVHMNEPKCLAEIAIKHYYYGRTLKEFLVANYARGILQVSPLRPALLKKLGSNCKRPSLLIGFGIYQIVKYGASGISFLLALIKT